MVRANLRAGERVIEALKERKGGGNDYLNQTKFQEIPEYSVSLLVDKSLRINNYILLLYYIMYVVKVILL